MIELFTTQDQVWMNKWDDFIENHPKGIHLQYSDWVKSYISYGFTFEIGLAVSNNEIIGGYAAVIASKFGFGFYCISNGPIVDSNNPEVSKGLLELAKSSAKKAKCCCLQITAPNLDGLLDYSPSSDDTVYPKKGKPFPFIYASNGLNWVDFNECNSPDAYLQTFVKRNLRRDIRSAQRKKTKVAAITCEKEIEKAYRLFENNAKIQNYSVRNWADFKPSLLDLVNRKRAIVLGSSHEGELKGAVLLMKAGGHFTYVMGGSVKEKPNLLVGELLQWNAIVESFENGFKGYNISLGGSKGVIDFKNKFSPKEKTIAENTCHWVFRPLKFSMYLKMVFILKKAKPFIANFLLKVKP